MSHAAPLAIGLTGAVLAIAVCAALVGPRLRRAMDELSGAPHRAQWWSRLCCTALVIGSLVATLLGYWLHGTAPTLLTDLFRLDPRYALFMPAPTAPREPDSFWVVVDMLRWTLAALQLSLVAIAAVVLTSTAARPRTSGAAGSYAPQ